MRTLYTCVLALLCAFGASAQTIVSGSVRDEVGRPIPFATVTEKGTKNAVTCEANGDFHIKVAQLPAQLVISSTGFMSKSIRVTEKERPSLVQLARSEAALEEVVVVAHGIRRRSAEMGYCTSSVSTALSGKVSGIKVTECRSENRPASAPAKGDAHTLTAGELSDFKKWSLWSDYSPEDFKTTSGRWGMELKQRYCVQLQNEHRKPIIGEPVYLVDAGSSDTIWAARTDNTGKAELWSDAGKSVAAGAVLEIRCGKVHQPALAWNAINRLELSRDCGASNDVDIAFVVDATGSMGDEIRYLQAELAGVIKGIKDAHGDINLRTGSVFYRDRGDQYLTRHSDLNTDAAPLLEFIKAQSAGGGGDFEEAVDDALAVALDSLHWSRAARARLLFLVLDAPPHDAARERMNGLMRQAAARGIRIIPVVCSGIDKPTEFLMRCLALATNGSYVFLTDDSGVGEAHIKPTTDNFKVELLSELLQRLVREMIFITPCDGEDEAPVTEAAPVKVQVYPNPAVDHVTLQSSTAIEELYLTDFTGKVLQKVQVGKRGRWRIELGAYPSGTYLIRYNVEGKGWGSAKVVLVH